MKYCPECGSKIKEGNKFCPECGTHIAKEKIEQKKEHKARTESKDIKICTIIFGILSALIIIVGIFFIGIAVWNWAVYTPPTAEEIAQQNIVFHTSGAPYYLMGSIPFLIFGIFGLIGTKKIWKCKKSGGVIALIFSIIGIIAASLFLFLASWIKFLPTMILHFIVLILNIALLIFTIRCWKKLN